MDADERARLVLPEVLPPLCDVQKNGDIPPGASPMIRAYPLSPRPNSTSSAPPWSTGIVRCGFAARRISSTSRAGGMAAST
ncbi:hypothetical protein, partial [Methanoculleus chikugoensis]|uniref:hypothetical protein n=1 Tax=Methanoculleus chikugoensis TaxID=118126 RepID=UPI001FB1C3E2